MTSLKELKKRISVAQATLKITSAMKLIATSKFRKVQKTLAPAKFALTSLESPINILYSSEPDLFDGGLWQSEPTEKDLVIVGTSFKGMCGGFNQGLIKRLHAFSQAEERMHRHLDYMFIGAKGYDIFKKEAETGHTVRLKTFFKNEKDLEGSIQKLTDYMFEQIEGQSYQRVYFAMNKYVSAISQQPMVLPIYPLRKVYVPQPVEVEYIPLLEPHLANFQKQYFEQLLRTRLRALIIENKLSEHASRMNAMDSAQTNAEDIIESLNIVYNKSRQSTITRELIEIIAGKEAL